MESGCRGTLTLRYREPDARFCAFLVPVEEVPDLLASWRAQGADERLIAFNESAPDTHIVLQGEYAIVNGEEWLYASTHKGTMRDALKTARHTSGAAVRRVLRSAMTPASYDEFCSLTERYPTSVIELDIYDIELGNTPGRNTIIWEVREY